MKFQRFLPTSLLLKKHLSLALFGLSSLFFLPTAWGLDPLPVTGPIVRISDMAPISVAQLVQAVLRSDVAVLGEVHDNPRHHQLRGELLRQLPAASKTVVAEHLNWRQGFKPQSELLTDLKAAGFDDTGWAWPLHQPLFEAVIASQMPLMGGNLPGESIKEVFKTRGQSLPEPVRVLLAKAPFDNMQRKALEEEIDQGHCGAMPASMFEGMTAVQRGRDAAMAEVALAHLPSVVLAGNGHAWKHLGVPFVVNKASPHSQTISVLFMEWDDGRPLQEKQAFLAELAPQADYVWLTPPQSREDPCAKLNKK
jgi:uncharacterized iron-regulated protein